MKCINCNNDVDEFYSEEFECPHCGDVIVLDYYHCTECGTMWKSQDDVPLFGVNLEDPSIPEDLLDLFDKIEEELLKMEEAEEGGSMNAFVHRCISCNTIAYEVAEDTYRCPECDFEWEVVKCE